MIDARPTTADRVRQVGVTLAEVACVFGTLVGTGVIGRRVAESSGGSLSSAATHIAPAGPAFSIWSMIYLGLFAYTVWQWLPGQAAAPRHRAVGRLVAASMLLNAGWLLVTQVDWIAFSVLVIVAMLAVLVAAVARLLRHPASGNVDAVITDGTLGAYLGWVCVATCANVAAALAAYRVRPGAPVADALAVVVVAVAALVGVALTRWVGAMSTAARWSIGLAVAWGLAWIAVGRTSGDPRSIPTAVAAGLGTLAVLTATATAGRRTARGRADADTDAHA
ncbi:tryptophan-rich sensory protein [Mobilicoccus pelagius]|uniref:tryptophan-rich sensory protein n=1 Tax=Mobilicoccus pelagius TaxID=746032 RepID=UPI0002EC02D9|nr:tryptophan-rich sensory protein [Mobilicoccus pelagius]